jgi:dienelactone hydrolase
LLVALFLSSSDFVAAQTGKGDIADSGPEPDPALNEQIVRIPDVVTLPTGERIKRDFVVSVFKPNGAGPFPLAVSSHGRPADRAGIGRSRLLSEFFVRRGFAVLVPTRIGYGASGYDIDPEGRLDSDCKRWRYDNLVRNVVTHIEATLAYARTQSWADNRRIVLVGESAGGFGSLVAAGALSANIRAVINFAGGAGGDPTHRPGRPCNPGDIMRQLEAAAAKKTIPTLWIYAKNDRYWGSTIPHQWHSGYVGAGGKAEFLQLPALGADNHDFVDVDTEYWMLPVERFLGRTVFCRPRSHREK